MCDSRGGFWEDVWDERHEGVCFRSDCESFQRVFYHCHGGEETSGVSVDLHGRLRGVLLGYDGVHAELRDWINCGY